MKSLLAVVLATVLLEGWCHLPPSEPGRIYWMSFLNAAREVRAEGVEAALPLYLRAVAGGEPPEAGFAAVVLWDFHESRGDPAAATFYRATAMEHLGDEAWTVWAGRPARDRRADDPYATDHLIVPFERLAVGVEAGSAAADAERTRRVRVLEMETAHGNAAARELLARVRAASLDRAAGA